MPEGGKYLKKLSIECPPVDKSKPGSKPSSSIIVKDAIKSDKNTFSDFDDADNVKSQKSGVDSIVTPRTPKNKVIVSQ